MAEKRDEKGRYAPQLTDKEREKLGVDVSPLPPIDSFHIELRGYIGGDVKINRYGFLVVPIVVAREDTELALDLWRAGGQTVFVTISTLTDEQAL